MSKQNIPSGLPAKITELVDGESDRGAILILSAYLDELLGDVIRAACTSDKKAAQILEFRQPAGDFSSKISLSFALGLIHETEATALNAVRKVRNSAAHFDKKGKGFDVLFDADQTIDQVGNLAVAMNLERPPRKPEQVKKVFIVSSRLLATKIIYRAIQIERPESPPAFKEIINKVREDLQGTEQGKRIEDILAVIKDSDHDSISARFKAVAAHIRKKIKASEKNKSQD